MQAHTLLQDVAGGREASTHCGAFVGHKVALAYLAQAATDDRMQSTLRQAQVVTDFADRLYRQG